MRHFVEQVPGFNDLAILGVGSKHGSPGDGISVGHAVEDGLGFPNTAISTIFGDLGIAVNNISSGTLGFGQAEARL